MAVETVFPVAMGNEEETGMLVTGEHPGEMVEPYYLAQQLRHFVPDDVRFAGSDRLFLENGGLLYVGGAYDHGSDDYHHTNIERATAECPDHEATTISIGAHEKLIVEVAKKYTESLSNAYDHVVEARIQRRSVDAAGNRKGCHDSYGYMDSVNVCYPFGEPRARQSFLGFLATRSFMTGAGHVTPYGQLRFSQKADGLIKESDYGYHGSMYRVAEPETLYGTKRIETRMNDVNISPWAVNIRLGGAGLLLAIAQTELVDDLPIYPGGTNHVTVAKMMNGLEFDNEGQLVPKKKHYQALDFQRRVAELALDKLQLYADVPDSYYRTAREMYEYCDDFTRVLKRESPFTILSDRSDVMAKFRYIQARKLKDEADGLSRSMTDIKAQMQDMMYDFIEVYALPYTSATVNYGIGYKLRDKGHFRFSHDSAAVDRAYRHPPQGMRGQVRAQAIREYDMSGCNVTMDWHEIRVEKDAKQGARGNTLGPVNKSDVLLSTRKFLDTTFPRRVKQ